MLLRGALRQASRCPSRHASWSYAKRRRQSFQSLPNILRSERASFVQCGYVMATVSQW